MANLCLGCMRQKNNSPICEHCGFDERKENLSHQLPIGTLLQNQYLVGKVLGQGGFGITYIGWDQHLSIPVAIKEYFPSGVVQRHTTLGTKIWLANGEEPKLFQKHSSRFLNEARVLAQLSDIAEIVQIRNYFSQNDTAYIVMEYVQGITLKEHLKKLGRPMTEAEALAIMEPVLKALQKVHEHGLIHRDISPDNIMLPTGGGIKLIDFGTVRYMDDSGKSKSTESILKPGFAPMEQYNTRGNLGTWTDVYALCATFHYLLTGKVPADVHERLEEGEQLPILRSTPGISRNLIETLEKGMQVRVSARIQTIGELYDLLYSRRPTPDKKPQTVPKKKKILIPLLCLAVAVIAAAALLLIPKKSSAPISQPEKQNISVPKTSEESVNLKVLWNGREISVKQVFGNVSSTGTDYVKVTLDGEIIADFTVQSDNAEYLAATREASGDIQLVQLKSFEGKAIGFTVTYQGNAYTYYCNDDSWQQGAGTESGTESGQMEFGSFTRRHYTNAQLQDFVDADLSFEDACQKLTTVADAVQYLKLRGYHFEHAGAQLSASSRFALNSGDGVAGSALFNALLDGDYADHGYVYVFYAEAEHVFNYFVLDGTYYFCDFVRVFGDEKSSYIYHTTTDPNTLYEAMLKNEPYDLNNPVSDRYLVALYTTGYHGDAAMPITWLRSTESGKYCHVPLAPDEKASQKILFMREGYTFEF